MKKKILFYSYPLIVIIPLALILLKPDLFYLIPQTIYTAFEISSMEEYEFSAWFTSIFFLLMYIMLLRVTKKILDWRQFNKKRKL